MHKKDSMCHVSFGASKTALVSTGDQAHVQLRLNSNNVASMLLDALFGPKFGSRIFSSTVLCNMVQFLSKSKSFVDPCFVGHDCWTHFCAFSEKKLFNKKCFCCQNLKKLLLSSQPRQIIATASIVNLTMRTRNQTIPNVNSSKDSTIDTTELIRQIAKF